MKKASWLLLIRPGDQGPIGFTGPQGPTGECDCPISQEQFDELVARIRLLEGGNIPRFTDMGNGTIRDNDSNLIWLKDASCYDQPDTFIPWTLAKQLAANLSDGTCGLSDGSVSGDWRLPTDAEWAALMSTAYQSPALVNTVGNAQWSEGDPFIGVQSNKYWSGTGDADVADLLSGLMTGGSGGEDRIDVWAVRESLDTGGSGGEDR
jgi:hypothetical protein